MRFLSHDDPWREASGVLEGCAGHWTLLQSAICYNLLKRLSEILQETVIRNLHDPL
ncbi:unnamed protein product, partial [Didymodactylos carnosus]